MFCCVRYVGDVCHMFFSDVFSVVVFNVDVRTLLSLGTYFKPNHDVFSLT